MDEFEKVLRGSMYLDQSSARVRTSTKRADGARFSARQPIRCCCITHKQ